MNRTSRGRRSGVRSARPDRRASMVAGLARALPGLLVSLSMGCVGAETSVEWLLEIEEGWTSPQARSDAMEEALAVMRARIAVFNQGGPVVGRVDRVGDGRILVRLDGYGAESTNLEPLFRVGKVAVHRVRRDFDPWTRFPGLDSVVDAHSPAARDPGFGILIPTEGDTIEQRVRIEPQTATPGDALPEAREGRVASDREVGMIDALSVGVYPLDAAVAEPVRDFLVRSRADRALGRPLDFALGRTTSVVPGEPKVSLYVLDGEPVMTSEDVQDAYVERSEGPGVAFALTRSGAARLEATSRRYVGERLAIVMDGRVVSDPVIRDRIGQYGRFDAPMGFSDVELYALALFLRTGPLPAPLVVVERRPAT